MAELLDGRFVLLGLPTRPGGFGDVRKAVDGEADGRLVAIKYLRSTHPDDPLSKLQFDREVSSLSRLQVPEPHPNIVELISAGFDETTGKQYIVLEWIEDDLHSLLTSKPWDSWDEFAASYALPLADALSYAHLREVQHRDIKPENVLVADGVPKLADFGIAKRQDILDSSGMTLIAAHTPPYAPPDKGVGAEFTRDVWALAVLMIRCMYDQALDDYPDINKALDEIDVPSDVRSLLRRCVDMDPQSRPQNGSVLARELEEIQGSRIARAARADSAVWLGIQNNALTAVMGRPGQDRNEGQQRVLMDLANRWYGMYQVDQQTQQIDRRTLLLYGREWLYVLKHHAATAKFMIVGARRGSPDYHAKDSARAKELTGIVQLSFRTVAAAKAEAGARLLLEAVEAHAASAALARDEQARIGAENRYFDDLLELLDAQEELAQGGRRPLQFRARKIRGREIDFDLTTTPEQDLSGQEWDIRVGRIRRFGRGDVVRQGSQSLTLLLSRNPRTVPERGELAPNLGASQAAHDRQTDAVQRVRDGAAVRPDLRELLLNPTSIRAPVAAPPSTWIQTDLDGDKRAAVAAALGAKDFLLVEGPPGTGKTTFIAETVAQFLARAPEAKVLIVSQTHVAVDNALERLSPTVGDGVVRLGKPEDPRVSESVHSLLLDQQMVRWAKEIKSNARTFVKSVAASYLVPEADIQNALDLQGLGTILAEIDQIGQSAHMTSSLSPDERTLTGVAQLTDRVAAQERLDWLAEQRDEWTTYLRAQLAGVLTLGSDLTPADTRKAIDALLGHTQLPPNMLAILRLQGEWLQRIESDRHLASAFLKTARVVAGTCVGFLSHPAVRDLEFDLCILDEASKATATEALVPLARSKRWVLVGDTKQLPPMDEEILREPELMERYHLDREFIETTMFDRLIEHSPSAVRHHLGKQYRMIRPIGDLISACFYKDTLQSPRTEGLEGLDRLTQPVVWLDTSRHGPSRFEERASGTSHLNRLEARIAVDRLRVFDQAISTGFVRIPQGSKLSVLLMAPYSRQIEELEGEVARLRPAHLDVLVKSVDAVQGRESDLAVFCVTRSNKLGRLGFLAEPYWRRINVALSRARFGLTIVGDADFCFAQPGALRDVIDHIKTHGSDCEIRQADVDRS